MPGDVVRTRPLAHGDLANAQRLLAAEGWSFSLPELQRLLSLGGGTTIEVEGTLAGLLTFTIHGPEAWIGNVVLDPAWRGRGLGERLVDAALADLDTRDVEVVRLYSVHAAETLYERLGFVREDLVQAFRRPAGPAGFAPELPRLKDATRVLDVDAEAFGVPRRGLLEALLADGNPAFTAPEGPHAGYVIAKPAPAQGVGEIGPGVVADADAAVAHALLAAAVATCSACDLEFAAPEEATAALAAAQGLGFVPTFTARTMRRGPDRYGGDPRRVLAAGGLEKG